MSAGDAADAGPFEVTTTREGRWWMVAIPALDGLTQARHVGEVEQMAREWIALTLDRPMASVNVHITMPPTRPKYVLADGPDIPDEEVILPSGRRLTPEVRADIIRQVREAARRDPR